MDIKTQTMANILAQMVGADGESVHPGLRMPCSCTKRSLTYPDAWLYAPCPCSITPTKVGYVSNTDLGPQKKLLEEFGLVEGQDDPRIYPKRTLKNIKDSDGTVIFGDTKERGSNLTKNLCNKNDKPCIINPTIGEFIAWMESNCIQILNVAGNTESKKPGILDEVIEFLVQAIDPIKERHG